MTPAEKLSKKQVADGEDYSNTRTIDEILKDRVSVSVFKYSSIPAFEKALAQMNLADMQRLASRAGLLPIYNREVLKSRLVAAFKRQLGNSTTIGYKAAEFPEIAEEGKDIVAKFLREAGGA